MGKIKNNLKEYSKNKLLNMSHNVENGSLISDI